MTQYGGIFPRKARLEAGARKPRRKSLSSLPAKDYLMTGDAAATYRAGGMRYSHERTLRTAASLPPLLPSSSSLPTCVGRRVDDLIKQSPEVHQTTKLTLKADPAIGYRMELCLETQSALSTEKNVSQCSLLPVNFQLGLAAKNTQIHLLIYSLTNSRTHTHVVGISEGRNADIHRTSIRKHCFRLRFELHK